MSRRPVRVRAHATTSAEHISRALLIVSMLSIVMMSVGTFFVSYHFLHEQTQEHLRTLIAFTASESRTALEFRDAATARDILQSIPSAEGIALAELRDANDDVLARVSADDGDVAARVANRLGAEQVSQDVDVDGKRVGRVVLRSGGVPLLRALAGQIGWGILVLLAVALASLLLGRGYTRRITQPILHLRGIVERLIEDRDFNRRAPRSDLTELEELRLKFNVLLEEIGIRDRLLTETNAALQRVAYVDSLTGLPNRVMFEQTLSHFIEGDASRQATLLYLDIDAFKTVNDTFGHRIGDALLSEIGARLRTWQPYDAIAARIGGDEFVVLLPLRPGGDVQALVASLQTALSAPMRIGGIVLYPGISIGVASYPDMCSGAEELIHLADRTMYGAKGLRRQRNEMTRWDTVMTHDDVA